eukprot:scaffold574413_cov37-Prasinocladus_malaysianus.AAC.1
MVDGPHCGTALLEQRKVYGTAGQPPGLRRHLTKPERRYLCDWAPLSGTLSGLHQAAAPRGDK